MGMRRIALYCNLFWIFFSLVVCVEAFRLRLGTITKPGSGLFPFSLGVVMLVLSLSALFQAIGRKNKDEKRTPQESFRWWRIVIWNRSGNVASWNNSVAFFAAAHERIRTRIKVLGVLADERVLSQTIH
jgi:hypothetical protein